MPARVGREPQPRRGPQTYVRGRRARRRARPLLPRARAIFVARTARPPRFNVACDVTLKASYREPGGERAATRRESDAEKKASAGDDICAKYRPAGSAAPGTFSPLAGAAAGAISLVVLFERRRRDQVTVARVGSGHGACARVRSPHARLRHATCPAGRSRAARLAASSVA